MKDLADKAIQSIIDQMLPYTDKVDAGDPLTNKEAYHVLLVLAKVIHAFTIANKLISVQDDDLKSLEAENIVLQAQNRILKEASEK